VQRGIEFSPQHRNDIDAQILSPRHGRHVGNQPRQRRLIGQGNHDFTALRRRTQASHITPGQITPPGQHGRQRGTDFCRAQMQQAVPGALGKRLN
jgi:hypothetical protein